ncbi:uncharacterized protein LOC127153346 [Labeo rohita]|uniref:uncharacterized protein LOC127153346 n=1 Tax=Labeo rohita TaxID=84645 RepID=UPI0021E2DE43|nr:uncharacterized protein LOC127153346 [Labeo rohita]
MKLRQLPLVLLLISNIYSQHTGGETKAKVTIKPAQHVFKGETVTLRCDIYDEGVTRWQYSCDHLFTLTHKFNMLLMSDFSTSVPRAVLSVSPQMWLTEGDSVTLICEVKGSSIDWTFSWFTETVSSNSSRGAGGNYTVSSAALNHTGVYVCRAERGKPAYNTTISNTQLIWVTGVSPPVSLIISPNRTQHFTYDSLSLSCEDQSDSTGWRVRRNTDKWGLEDCSSSESGSQTGSTCKISPTASYDTGVYWCESESGEKNHPVNITVHSDVILESPVHPVTEGDTLTLHCLYQHTTPPNLRADFYKDESLIQSQTTEMIISTVSKSHEGFYYCKHPERGESPKSWISVTASSRRSGSDGLNPVIVGVSAGLTVTFLIVVFLVLLWCYRNNKGSSSAILKFNDADYFPKPVMCHIVSGATELTNAEIELKSTEKQKKKKENKGKTSESSDTVYYKLTLVTHQGECQNKNINHNSQGAAENCIYKHR